MRAYIVFNPRAGSAHQAEALREHLADRSDVTLCTPEGPGETRDCVRGAVRDRYDLIVAAGGDGTIHAVVNALAPDFAAPLAVLPLGTGNDLRRTLAVPEDPLEALAGLDRAEVHAIDVLHAGTASQEWYTINVASGGFSGQLQEVLTDEMKATWGPLAYLRGAAGVLPDLKEYHTELAFDGGPAERVEALNVIVANGRYAAKGWQVASAANPEDGLLDVVTVRSGTLPDLAGVAARLLAADYLGSDLVTHRRARTVRVASRPGMWFSMDGELLTNEPITFTVRPRAVKVVVGPDYRAEPG